MACSLGPSSWRLVGVSLRYTCPVRVTATTSCCSSPVSAAAFPFGRLMFPPCCRIGAVTMKITSSTSITSTSGVTSMLEIAPPPCSSNAMRASLLQKMTLGDIQEFRGKVLHVRLQHADLPSKMVVGHYRRDRGDQPGCGG